MSGRPTSYYEYSGGGSAADAYNTPSAYGADQPYSEEQQQQQHQHQHQLSTASNPALPPMAPVAPPHQGNGTGMYETRPTHSNGYAMANDDDDDDEDEDWNVYDDFNMTRPLSTTNGRDSLGGLQSHQEGYWDATTPGTTGGDSKADLQTPYSDYPQRKSLLNSDAFGFDVRNADPRRSMPPVTAGAGGVLGDGARGNDAHRISMLSGAGAQHADSTTGIELITVPALGTEFSKEEMRDMTRKSKKKKKRSAKKQRLGAWVRGEDYLCGWLSPRVAVFMAFIFLVLLGVMLFFVIPRVPSFAFLSTNPVTAVPDGASMLVHHSPTNFSMTMDLNLRADNSDGWLPTVARDMKVTVYDATQNKKVGEGKLDRISFPGRKRTVFKFPVDFAYVSLNATGDTTFLNFYEGCGPKIPNTPRPSLNLKIIMKMKIQGLIGSKGASTTVGNIDCPFTLQNYQ